MPRRSSSASHPLTEHEEIRNWAESRGARPTCVRGTGEGEDAGMIRLDFPGYSGEDSLQEISWDDWFQKFDENNLVLLVQDTTAGGEQSNFNKLVTRDTAEQKQRGRRAAGRRAARRQRTTASRLTEDRPATRATSRSASGGKRSGRRSAVARGRKRATRPTGRSRTSSRSRGRAAATGRREATTGRRSQRRPGRKSPGRVTEIKGKRRSASSRSSSRRKAA